MPTIYPHIEVDPEELKVHCFSTRLADLVSHKWDLTDRTPENTILLLYSIQVLQEAIDKIGWVEHTSDWDWTFEITMKDSTLYSAYSIQILPEDNWILLSGQLPTQLKICYFSEPEDLQEATEDLNQVLEISDIASIHCFYQ